MTRHHEDDDDEDEDEFLKDGESIRFPMTFMDAARNQEIKAACDERNAMRNLSPEEQRRIAEKAAYASASARRGAVPRRPTTIALTTISTTARKLSVNAISSASRMHGELALNDLFPPHPARKGYSFVGCRR